MKTTIEIGEYMLTIEENNGVISVTAEMDGDVVEEFTLSSSEQGGEKSAQGQKEVQNFGQFEEEDDFEDDEDEDEDEDEYAQEEDEEGEEDEYAQEEDEDDEEDMKSAQNKMSNNKMAQMKKEPTLESFGRFIKKRKLN